MPKLTRRNWLEMAGTAPLLSAAPEPPRKGVWIDPKMGALKGKQRRKVHPGFHNTQHIPRIDEKFNTDEFGDALVNASIDSVAVFAGDGRAFEARNVHEILECET